MNYPETVNYLFSRLPMYQRIGPPAYKANLNNTIRLCALLGNPEKKIRTIHIAGTNGKGSVSHLLASVLQESGYKVGLFTSPHLKDYRERIRINGKKIPPKYILEFVNKFKEKFEPIGLSFFEWTAGLAFQYFLDKKVDIAVIETGLGGRLDSTNVIEPWLSVITNISKDHTALLGNTLWKIAAEKAGIIKPLGLTLIGERQKEVASVFVKKAKELKGVLFFAEDLVKAKRGNLVWKKNKPFRKTQARFSEPGLGAIHLTCGLAGDYQVKNIQTACAALSVLRQSFLPRIKKKSVKEGFLKVIPNTMLRGRWEVLSKNPMVITDTGHNEAGIREVFTQIGKIKKKKLRVVWGMLSDKNPDPVLKLLPTNAIYYFCKPSVPRGLEANELMKIALKKDLKGSSFSSPKKALKKAIRESRKGDLVFVGGSTFVVSDIL